MKTPIIDDKVLELQTSLKTAIRQGNRPLVETIRGALLELLLTREALRERSEPKVADLSMRLHTYVGKLEEKVKAEQAQKYGTGSAELMPVHEGTSWRLDAIEEIVNELKGFLMVG